MLDILSETEKCIAIGDDFNIDILVDARVQCIFFDLISNFNLNVQYKF